MTCLLSDDDGDNSAVIDGNGATYGLATAGRQRQACSLATFGQIAENGLYGILLIRSQGHLLVLILMTCWGCGDGPGA